MSCHRYQSPYPEPCRMLPLFYVCVVTLCICIRICSHNWFYLDFSLSIFNKKTHTTRKIKIGFDTYTFFWYFLFSYRSTGIQHRRMPHSHRRCTVWDRSRCHRRRNRSRRILGLRKNRSLGQPLCLCLYVCVLFLFCLSVSLVSPYLLVYSDI